MSMTSSSNSQKTEALVDGPLVAKLDCTNCHDFVTFWEEQEEVVRCNNCDKRHSWDSVYHVKPEKTYKRDRHGELIETPP